MLARWPVPRRTVEASGACDTGLAGLLFERDAIAAALLLESGDEARRVRHDDRLRALGSARNEPRKRRQEVRVQAGFRFVQHEQARRPGRKECRNPEEIAQGAVGKFSCAQRPEEAVLLHLDLEAVAA